MCFRYIQLKDGRRVPCGQCLECRLKKRREWGARVTTEMKYHAHNYFLTITYNDEHIGDNKLSIKDLQLFNKRLRKKMNYRYFACGEYGDKTNRKHYHMIMMCKKPIEDLKFYKYNFQNNELKNSEWITRTWGKGYVAISEANFDTASYVAGYIIKKATKEAKDEFITMSNGIGKRYYQDRVNTIYGTDSIHIKKGDKIITMKPPRYFDKLKAREEGLEEEKNKWRAIWGKEWQKHITSEIIEKYEITKKKWKRQNSAEIKRMAEQANSNLTEEEIAIRRKKLFLENAKKHLTTRNKI